MSLLSISSSELPQAAQAPISCERRVPTSIHAYRAPLQLPNQRDADPMVEDKLEYANIDFALVISGEYGDEPLHLLVQL